MQSPEDVAGQHLAIFNELYMKLNPLAKEELEAGTIAAFLRTARGVSVAQLSQVWEVASELSGCKNKAALNRLGVFMCFKLIAAAQQGFPVAPAALTNPTLNAPHFDVGVSAPPPAARPHFGSKSPSICSELDSGFHPMESGWAVSAEEQHKYDRIFDGLGPVGGRLSGEQCRPVLLNSQLPKAQLAKIWDLADIDADGHLDRPEFYVALHLVYRALQGEPIPERLPLALVPFSKRAILRHQAVRSVDPTMVGGGGHAPPLTWSSRASSVASLNIQQPPMMPAVPPAMGFGKPQQQQQQSLFERNMDEWHVENLGQFEAEFVELDKDKDGLVTGVDVRDVFLRSGLPQPMLARIWAHVDVKKTGLLNLEQFAKCSLVIRECQESEKPNTAASPPLPSSGPLARRDSQISTNSSTGTKQAIVSENPRVQELMAAIEEMQANRRKAEQDLFQAEADMKVKNSEVKNLEIELLTLEATVKQLRNQRVEANKRLNDLDTRVAKLEGVCEENQRRLEEEEARLARTKLEIQQARENSEQEADILDGLRAEVSVRRQRLAASRQALNAENAKFEGYVDKLTQYERGIARHEEESVRLRAQMEEMQRILDAVEKGEEGASQELLEKTFESPIEKFNASKESSVTFPPDPFKEDPFQRTPGNDPFLDGGNSTAVADDPFGGAPATASQQSSGQFANFANFSAFS